MNKEQQAAIESIQAGIATLVKSALQERKTFDPSTAKLERAFLEGLAEIEVVLRFREDGLQTLFCDAVVGEYARNLFDISARPSIQ